LSEPSLARGNLNSIGTSPVLFPIVETVLDRAKSGDRGRPRRLLGDWIPDRGPGENRVNQMPSTLFVASGGCMTRRRRPRWARKKHSRRYAPKDSVSDVVSPGVCAGSSALIGIASHNPPYCMRLGDHEPHDGYAYGRVSLHASSHQGISDGAERTLRGSPA
jgi:hypothetical protein